MKNLCVENLKRKAKACHKYNKRNRHYENGVLVRHCYDHLEGSTTLAWWDDFGFILNDYKVSVAWQHPRDRYADEISELADSLAQEKFPDAESGHKKLKNFSRLTSTPNYIKVGKSRKKINTLNFNRDFINGPLSDQFEESKKIEQIICYTSDIKVNPNIRSRWTKHSRFVSVCLPMEIRNESDLRVLVSIVKQLLKRETTLDQLFSGYVYTKDNWLAEKGQREPNDLHTHFMD